MDQRKSGAARRALEEQNPSETKRVTSRRRTLRLVPFIVAALVGLVLFPETASAGAPTTFGFSGDAYGTQVRVGNTVKSGPTARSVLGCTSEVGVTNSNVVAGVNVPGLLTSNTVRTSVSSLQTNNGVATRSVAETEQVNILGGLIRADLVKAVATTSHNGSGFQTSGAGSTLVNLVIGNESINATPGPNTTIDLDGLGKVVLNEQKKSIKANQASITVNMIHVFITVPGNLLGIPTGTEIIVSHARAALGGPVEGLLDGFAYGSKVNVANVVKSGPSQIVYMPCLGTNGQLKVNELVGLNVPGILTAGTVRNTAQGSTTQTGATGETTSTIQSLNLLNGFITADVVKADAHATRSGGTNTFSDEGSGILNLSVSGHPEITADAGPNTRINLLGIGVLWLHRVIKTPNSIEVRMIELIITDAGNPFGLALNTRIQVAVAKASVHG